MALDDKSNRYDDKKVTAGERDLNPDPITGAPGSHPTGTGIGSASGAATGAAIGMVGGPVGAIIGGVAGAIVGAAIGHGVGEYVDPTVEDEYWKTKYIDQPYGKNFKKYDDVQPAFRSGYEGFSKYGVQKDRTSSFEDVESNIRSDYESGREDLASWDDARPAARDAYERVSNRYSTSGSGSSSNATTDANRKL